MVFYESDRTYTREDLLKRYKILGEIDNNMSFICIDPGREKSRYKSEIAATGIEYYFSEDEIHTGVKSPNAGGTYGKDMKMSELYVLLTHHYNNDQDIIGTVLRELSFEGEFTQAKVRLTKSLLDADKDVIKQFRIFTEEDTAIGADLVLKYFQNIKLNNNGRIDLRTKEARTLEGMGIHNFADYNVKVTKSGALDKRSQLYRRLHYVQNKADLIRKDSQRLLRIVFTRLRSVYSTYFGVASPKTIDKRRRFGISGIHKFFATGRFINSIHLALIMGE